MDMNRTFYLKKEDRKPKWWVIDAEGKILGRLASEIADMLRGKNKPSYTPHTDSGDYVVVINADKVALSGKKWTTKVYAHYTGWRGGYKERTAQEVREKRPTDLIYLAVKGMLPKNKLNRQIIKKLKLYTTAEHPHKAQEVQKYTLKHQ